ncbi:MAG: IclR family transcriptional regulator [Lachnospiraceae bacterium]
MKIHRTVNRAINMLEIISNHSEGVSLNEISEIMEIPKSSCFDILHTLVNTDMIEPIGRDGKTYRIGIRSFLIGNQYMMNKKFMEIAQPKIEKIGDRFGKSVFLAEDSLDKVVYVYKYQPKDISVVASCTVGTKMEYYNTALGKCMLAFKDNFVELIDKAYEDHVVLDKEKLILEVIAIRKKKFVFSDQEHQKQLFCIASPIFDHRGEVLSALSISGIYSSDEMRELECKYIHTTAEAISREIGFVGEY